MSDIKVCNTCGIQKSIKAFRVINDRRRDKLYTCAKCRDCEKEYSRKNAKKSYHKHREKRLKASKEWHENNRFKASLLDAKCVARRKGHAACIVTEEEIEGAFDGSCKVCGAPEIELGKKLCMDHNHDTGEFRGWLCSRCNKILGLAKDNEDVLFALTEYLLDN